MVTTEMFNLKLKQCTQKNRKFEITEPKVIKVKSDVLENHVKKLMRSWKTFVINYYFFDLIVIALFSMLVFWFFFFFYN